jgi:hypothetical protein
VCPSGHVTVPVAQCVRSHCCGPNVPQSIVQLALGSHVAWHGGERHAKLQWLPAPHVHAPSAQTPLQCGLSPAQETWHGAELQAKSQVAPSSHVHAPFAHVAVHDDPDRQSMLHGGDAQSK